MINNAIIHNVITNILEADETSSLAGIGMYLCNTSSKDDSVTIHAIESGASASATNTVVKDLVVAAGETYEFGAEKFLLEDGERLAAKASAGNRISATITYTEI